MNATKQQEREALAKIRKIVEGLGENSYVGTALDGALELAEQNIDMDAAFTTSYYIEKANSADSQHLQEKQQWSVERVSLESRIEALGVTVGQMDVLARELRIDRDEFEQALDRAKDGLKSRDSEIIALKAKLYDRMTKDAE